MVIFQKMLDQGPGQVEKKPHQVSELAKVSFNMPQLALSIQKYTIRIDYKFYFNWIKPKTAKIGENVHFSTISAYIG